MIREHLLLFGSITPEQARTEYACARLSARISELRDEGMTITTKEKTVVNRFGKKVKFAEKYILTKEVNKNEQKNAEDIC
jgi:hypothetical protein